MSRGKMVTHLDCLLVSILIISVNNKYVCKSFSKSYCYCVAFEAKGPIWET